jgi:hypothetical protein
LIAAAAGNTVRLCRVASNGFSGDSKSRTLAFCDSARCRNLNSGQFFVMRNAVKKEGDLNNPIEYV